VRLNHKETVSTKSSKSYKKLRRFSDRKSIYQIFKTDH
jgi:hypothetical protein